MTMSINTNVMSLNAQRNLSSSGNNLATALQRLSSGLRINSAKDDAAGLAVAQRMGAQIGSLNQAARNANDGISMIQTAEGALQEVQNMLQRMKELATQAASDTISDKERGYINTEIQELRDQINDVGDGTTFNGQKVLSGALTTSLDATTVVNKGSVVQSGTNTSVSAVDVSRAAAGTTFTFTDNTATGLELSDGTTTQEIAYADLAVAADGSTTLNYDQLGVSITVSSVTGETGANVAAGLTTDTIITAAGNSSAVVQIGSGTTANVDTITLSFSDVRISATNADADLVALNTALDDFNTGTATRTEASALMGVIDTALDAYSDERAKLGAVQNRMESTIANLQITSENVAAARGRIIDTDFAAETAALTRAQILQQAGTAMLAQANAAPQSVLALLQ